MVAYGEPGGFCEHGDGTEIKYHYPKSEDTHRGEDIIVTCEECHAVGQIPMAVLAESVLGNDPIRHLAIIALGSPDGIAAPLKGNTHHRTTSGLIG